MAPSADQTSPQVLCLAAVATIREVSALRDAVLALLQGGAPAVIDCSAVEKADVSLVQLLVSARRMAERDGGRLEFVIPPSGLVAALIRRGGFDLDVDGTGMGR